MAKKEYTYRGHSLKELQDMSNDEFMELLPTRERRTLKRGLTGPEQSLIKKLGKRDKVKTHCREMIVLPMMVEKVISVHTGKEFVDVHVQADMIGMRLGQFVMTRKKVSHSGPGVGATRSSAHVSVR